MGRVVRHLRSTSASRHAGYTAAVSSRRGAGCPHAGLCTRMSSDAGTLPPHDGRSASRRAPLLRHLLGAPGRGVSLSRAAAQVGRLAAPTGAVRVGRCGSSGCRRLAARHDRHLVEYTGESHAHRSSLRGGRRILPRTGRGRVDRPEASSSCSIASLWPGRIPPASFLFSFWPLSSWETAPGVDANLFRPCLIRRVRSLSGRW